MIFGRVIVHSITKTVVITTYTLPLWELAAWLSDKLLTPIIVGSILAVAGLIVSRANEKYKAQREHISSTVSTLRSKVDDAVDDLTIYWNSNYDAEKSPVQAARIEYLIQDISGLIGICLPDLWRDEQGSDGPQLFEGFVAAATGSNFNSISKRPNPGKGLAAATAAAALLEGVSLEMGKFHRRSMFHSIFRALYSGLRRSQS